MSLQALSARLSEHGVEHVIVAAEGKIKVTTKIDIPKDADQLISDHREGENLRDRTSIEKPSRLKLTNMISKNISKYGIAFEQKPHYTWTIRVHKFGKQFGDPMEYAHKYKVMLVDPKTKKPVYTKEELGDELELIEVKD